MTARTLNHQIDDIVALAAANQLHLERPALFVLSGAAFRTYVFNPEDNYAWTESYPDRPFHPDDLLVDNYGVMEAVTGHFDLHTRPYQLQKVIELRALHKHEAEDGRHVLVQFANHEPSALLHKVEAQRSGITLEFERSGERFALAHEDLSTADDFVRTLGTYLTLRSPGKGPDAVPHSRRNALTRDALSWALQHFYARRELAHHLELFFAAGHRAWEVLNEQLRRLDEDHAHTPLASAYRDHAALLLESIADARQQAAEFFRRSDLIDAHLVRDELGDELLEKVVSAAEQSAAEVSAAAKKITTLPTDVASDRVRHCAGTDQRFFAALEAAVRVLEPHREFRPLFF